MAGYVDRMRDKYTAKWSVQMAGMNFQTHSITGYDIKTIAVKESVTDWHSRSMREVNMQLMAVNSNKCLAADRRGK